MKLFNRKNEVTEARVKEQAERLILGLSSGYSPYTAGLSPSPASSYVHELVKDQMKNAEIKDKLDSFLCGEIFNSALKEHINNALSELLKENLIESIVSKINAVQINNAKH